MLYSFDTEHRDFQIVLRGVGISLQWGKAGITNFLLGGENLRKSDFDHLNLFQS